MAVALLVVASAPGAQTGRQPRISASGTHGIYIDSHGNRFAWGSNERGEFGGGLMTPPGKWMPQLVAGRKDIVGVAAGFQYTLFLLADGTAMACGLNQDGQCGIGRIDIAKGHRELAAPVSPPEPIAGLSGVKQLAAAPTFALALMQDGTVMAWGSRGEGHLGEGEVGPYADRRGQIPTPQPVKGLTGVRQIAAGGDYALALLSDGTVVGWGYALNGELGEAVTSKTGTPTPIRGLQGVKQIAAFDGGGMALLEDGTVRTWGKRGCGIVLQPRLAHPNEGFSAKPVAVPGLSGVRTLVGTCDAAHVMAILTDGTVRTWGYNGHYEQGLGNNGDYPNRVSKPAVTGVVAGAFMRSCTFYVRADGSLLISGIPPDGRPFRVPTVLIKGFAK